MQHSRYIKTLSGNGGSFFMLKINTREQAVQAIRSHRFTYWPMDITRHEFCSNVDEDTEGMFNMTVAALIGMIWLESVRLNGDQLARAWTALDDINSAFSKDYIAVDFDTALMMIDKAAYAVSVMRGN